MIPTKLQLANVELGNAICKEYMSRTMSIEQIAKKHGIDKKTIQIVLSEQLSVRHTLIRERKDGLKKIASSVEEFDCLGQYHTSR